MMLRRRHDTAGGRRNLCWLPLGYRAQEDRADRAQEQKTAPARSSFSMPTLQLADLWRESGRYDAYGPEMLRIKDRHEREMLYGPTNEDMVTEIFALPFAPTRTCRSTSIIPMEVP